MYSPEAPADPPAPGTMAPWRACTVLAYVVVENATLGFGSEPYLERSMSRRYTSILMLGSWGLLPYPVIVALVP